MAGTVHVDQMLESMTPEEFEEWCAKDEIEPIGYASQALGMLCWFLYSWTAGGKGEAAAEDFMPWLKHAPKKPSDNDVARQLIGQMAGMMRRKEM